MQTAAEQAQVRILGPLGQFAVQIAAGLIGFATADAGLQDHLDGAQIDAPGPTLADLLLQKGQPVLGAVLAQKQGGLQGATGGLGLGGGDLAQGFADLLRAGPVAGVQRKVGQHAQHADMGGIDAARFGQHGIGRLGSAVAQQELGIAQGFRRGRARHLDRQRQPFACQIQRAVAFMRGGHQCQDGGVAGGLTQSGAQIDNRIAGLVFVDQPGGALFQRVDHGGVFGQHLFDARARTHAVAGGVEHPRQHGFDAPGLIAGLCRFQHRLHRDDGLGLAAGFKVECGIQRTVKVGIGGAVIRCDQRFQLGLRGLGSAGGLQQLHHRYMAFHRPGRPSGQLAQEGFGPVDIALRHIPGDQRAAHFGVVGKAFDHGLKLCAGAGGVARLRQNAQLGCVHVQRQRVQRQGAVNLGQGGFGIGTGGQMINQHPQGDAAVGGGGQDGAGGIGGLGAGGLVAGQHGLTVFQRHGDGAHAGGIGGQTDRLGAMTFGLGPVAAGDGQFGQDLADIGGVGVLFNQAQILTVSLLQIALFQNGVGIGLTGLFVKAVVFENVAEFHQRALCVARLQQGQPGDIIAVGLFLGTFAAAEGEGGDQGKGCGGEQAGQAHGGSIIGVGASAVEHGDPQGMPKHDGSKGAIGWRPPVRRLVSSRCRAAPPGWWPLTGADRWPATASHRSGCHNGRGRQSWSHCARTPATCR